MLYPLFFKPVYKSIIWGGRNLETVFNRSLPLGNIAESWDVCCHKNGMSIVVNGEQRGKSLEELITTYGTSLIGEKSNNMDRFPLLIKLIDANDKLSIQVHPGNEYALKAHGDLGKTEMWYVIKAKPNAKLVYGTLPGTTREEMRDALINGTIEEKLNYVKVKADDIIFIPSGTIHAIMDGLLIAEIQQNSDTTYRVYDWNRCDASGGSRELHIERALDVIDFNFQGTIKACVNDFKIGYSISHIVDCEFFKVDKLVIDDVYADVTNGKTFLTYTCVSGSGIIEHDNVVTKIDSGSSFMLPANMGDYKIEGNMVLLKSYI
jgi:mannose-6-phosphate isomerase